MRIRQFRAEDVKIVDSWWTAQGEKRPPENTYKNGYIAEVEGEPAVAVAVNRTSNNMLALVEAFVANPEVQGRKRRIMIDRLQRRVEADLKEVGCPTMIAFTVHERLHKRHLELGYKEFERPMHLSVKNI